MFNWVIHLVEILSRNSLQHWNRHANLRPTALRQEVFLSRAEAELCGVMRPEAAPGT